MFSNPSGTWNIGDPEITTDFQMNSPEDTVSLIVYDLCGRQTIFFETLSDPPPTVDLDGDDTTTPPNDTGYNGFWQAGGAITDVTAPDVVVTDNSGIITSAVIDLTNRLGDTRRIRTTDRHAAVHQPAEQPHARRSSDRRHGQRRSQRQQHGRLDPGAQSGPL